MLTALKTYRWRIAGFLLLLSPLCFLTMRFFVREILPPIRVMACEVFPVKKYDVPLPPVDAAPEQVVTTYLQAVDARDTDTADALSSPEFLHGQGRREFFCGYTGVDHIKVGSPSIDTFHPPGTYRYVLNVNAWYMAHEVTEGTQGPDGQRAFGYKVGRNKKTERWRILEYGNG